MYKYGACKVNFTFVCNLATYMYTLAIIPRYKIKMIMYTLEQLQDMATLGKDGRLFVYVANM